MIYKIMIIPSRKNKNRKSIFYKILIKMNLKNNKITIILQQKNLNN